MVREPLLLVEMVRYGCGAVSALRDGEIVRIEMMDEVRKGGGEEVDGQSRELVN
jgi:hypothetical protein